MANILYVVEHAPDRDVLRTYEGVSAEVVSGLVAEGGHGFEFITEADYKTRESQATNLLSPGSEK